MDTVTNAPIIGGWAVLFTPRKYIFYAVSEFHVQPETGSGYGEGSFGSPLAPRRHRLVARTNEMEIRDRTNPHKWEYGRFHFSARQEARRFVAALASVPNTPSTENTRGVNWRLRAWQGARYFCFFSRSLRARTLVGS